MSTAVPRPGANDPTIDRGPSGPNAPSSGPLSEAQKEEEAEQRSQEAFMRMLIEDARNGRVKDPKGRNVKRRRDKKTPGGPKLAKRCTDAQRSSGTQGVNAGANESAESDDSEAAGSSIDSAQSSVSDLKNFLTPKLELGGSDELKLVKLHELI